MSGFYFFNNDRYPTAGITNQIGYVIDHVFALRNLILHEKNYLFLDTFFLDPTHRAPFSDMIDIAWIDSQHFFPYIRIIDIMDPRYPLLLRWKEDQEDFLLEGQEAKKWLLERFRGHAIKEGISMIELEVPGRVEEIITLYVDDYKRSFQDIEYRKAIGVGMIGILQHGDFRSMWRDVPFCTTIPLPDLEKDLTGRVNIVHLRNESDIVLWNDNKDEGFIDHESEKYKKIISEHLTKEDTTIILTGRREENPVIEWMRQEGYQVILPRAYTPHLQLNAALDIQLAQKYGNHILITSHFSSFSIWLTLRLTMKKILEVM